MVKIAHYLMAGVSVLMLIYACANGGKVIPSRDDESVDYGDHGQQVMPEDQGDYGQDVRRRKTITQ